MRQIFVSHSSRDSGLAQRLVTGLRSLKPDDIYHLSSFHETGPGGGTDWTAWIRRTVANADLVLFLATAHSGSAWCSAELGMANLLSTPILPLYVGRRDDINPLALVSRAQAEPLDQPPERILRLIDDLIGSPAQLLSTGGGDGIVPYPGLSPLGESQAALLFGRESDTRRMVRSFDPIVTPRFVVLSGPSGSGKSSLARAGLLPRLRRDGWTIVGPLQPRQLADDGLPVLPSRRPALVFVDQAEELLLLDSEQQELQSQWFGEAVEFGIWVLLVVRSEYRPDLDPLISKPIDHYVSILDRTELYDIIRGPARLANLSIEERLVDRLVSETGSGEALPLLAMTLKKLWDERDRRSGQLQWSTLVELGGVRGYLAEAAGASLHSASGGDAVNRQAVLSMLTRLATPDRQPPTRSPVRLDTLTADELSWLDQFVASGLVAYRTSFALDDVIDDHARPTGDQLADATHEAFFSWPPLANAIAQERERNELIRSIERSADDWAASSGDKSLLLTGDRLRFAQNERLARRGPQLDAFVTASRRRDTENRVRKLLVGSLVAALVLAGVAATIAFQQRDVANQERDVAKAAEQAALGAEADARRAELETQSLRVAAEAISATDDERDFALLAAVGAHRISENPATEGALTMALTAPTGPVRYFSDDRAEWSTLRLLDENRGLVAGPRRNLHVVDFSTAELERIGSGTILDDIAIDEAELVPNSTLVVFRGRHKSEGWVAGIYDFNTNTTEWVINDEEVMAAAASMDHLAIGDMSGAVKVAVRTDSGLDIPVTIDRHQGSVITDLAVSQSDRIASASLAGVRINQPTDVGWTDAVVLDERQPGARSLQKVAFDYSNQSDHLYAAGTDPNIHRWAFPDDGSINGAKIVGSHIGGVEALAVASETGILYTAGATGSVHRWSLDSGGAIGEPLTSHRDNILALSPLAGSVGNILISAEREMAIVWDLSNAWTVEREGVVPASWRDLVVDALVDGDGAEAIITVDDRLLVSDGRSLPAPEGVTWRAWWVGAGDSVVFEQRNVTQPRSGVSLWQSIQSDAPKLVAEGLQAADVGRCLAVMADSDGVYYLDVGSCGREPPTVGFDTAEHRELVVALALSGDESQLAVADQLGRVHVIDVDTGEIETSIESTQPTVATALAWLPDGRIVVGHDIGGQAELIDLTTNSVTILPFHRDAVRFIDGSTDGTRLFLGSEDATISQIDVTSTPRLVATLSARQRLKENDDDATVFGLKWSGDGALLSIQNRELTTWELDPELLAIEACDRSGRDLTSSEAIRLGMAPDTSVCSASKS